MNTPGDRALMDLHQVVDGALHTNGALLSAGERELARRLRSLSGDAGRLYVRLLGRKGAVFRQERLAYDDVGDLAAAVAGLVRADLASRLVGWPERLPLYTLDELKAVCRRQGLKRGGRRAQVEERLMGRVDWADDPVFRVVGKRLVRKLEILWFRSPWRDRTSLLLERLGQTRWASYDTTDGGRAFARRAQLQAYLRALRGGDESPEEALERVRALSPRPIWMRGLDPRRIWVGRAADGARQLERDGEAQRARAVYEGLLQAGLRQPGPVAKRLALTLEASSDPAQGARTCVDWLEKTRPENRPSLTRTGRRLSRKAGLPWRPPVPLRKPPERTLALPFDDTGWNGGHRIEWGVIHQLAPRRALHGENTLWTTLFGLVFLDLYWLPVPGMLPAPYLGGPVDLGTPGFLDNRRQAVDQRMSQPLEAVVRRNHQQYQGCIANGVWWDLDVDVVASIADRGKPLLWRLLREGWGAARGLPDLAVLPGDTLRVPDLFPGRLDPGLLLVEVKGPNDQVRDEQAVWHDVLVREGVPVEVWRVRPSR